MKILVAEDDPTSHRILKTVLEKAGYEVVSCVNGAEAIDALTAEGAPSLAVLDWMMPKMEGIEVCDRLRQMEKTLILKNFLQQKL